MFDAIVVGAGPAGSSAAIGLARRGASVLLLERGEYPGAKNMFGGMMSWCPAAEELVPGFWSKAPWERAVTKRVLTVTGEGSSTSLVFQAGSGSGPAPRSGAGSTLRPHADRVHALPARFRPLARRPGGRRRRDAADELPRRPRARARRGVRGVRLAGSGDAIEAPLVVACDGALSLLAKDGGLHGGFTAEQVGLGVRALYALDRGSHRRALRAGRTGGRDQRVPRLHRGRPRRRVHLHAAGHPLRGLVDAPRLAQGSAASRPTSCSTRFTASPQVAKLLRGARLVEYSAHLLAEAGPG